MSIELNTINLLNILLLLGVLQGGIVAILLFFKKTSRLANRILAIWIFLFVLSNTHIIIQTSSLSQLLGQRFTLLAPLTLNLFYGPLIWLFCLKITDTKNGIPKKAWWHLLPGGLEWFYYLLVFIQPLVFRQQFYGQVHWPYIEPILEVLATASFIYYLLISIRLIQDYKKRLRSSYADPNLETYYWLRQFLIILLLFSMLWLILTFVDVFLMGYQLGYIYFYPYYLLIAFISYFIGFSGYYRTGHIVLDLPIEPKTNTSLLSEIQLDNHAKALQRLMQEQKLFLNNQLRAHDVAKALDLNVQTLSYVLNQGLSLSFHDFINQLRVEEVKIQLAGNVAENITLLGIAQAAGFNSESSFYRIFKQHTGMTPKAYLQHVNDK